MPLYAWQGLDLSGQLERGVLFARSLNDLERILLKKNIGLIKAQQSLFTKKITPHERLLFFSHLHSLIRARIPLHDALTSIAATTHDRQLKEMVADCAALIAEGRSLSESLFLHGITDELSYALLVVAEKTGDVAGVLEKLTDHMNKMMAFKQKLRASLLGPALTFLFFLLVMTGIFTLVIPRFEAYFALYHAPLPLITKIVLGVSSFMRSIYCVGVVLGAGALTFLASYFFASNKTRNLKDTLCFSVGKHFALYCLVQRTRFFTTLSMLNNHSIAMFEALVITETTMKNTYIRNEIAPIAQALQAGQFFSDAAHRSFFSSPEIDAHLTIGESSGSLTPMLVHIAELSQQKVYVAINRWVALVQPLLILLLGILIAGLIFAVYMPIISLSSLVE